MRFGAKNKNRFNLLNNRKWSKPKEGNQNSPKLWAFSVTVIRMLISYYIKYKDFLKLNLRMVLGYFIFRFKTVFNYFCSWPFLPFHP